MIDGSKGLRLSLIKVYDLWLVGSPKKRSNIEPFLMTHHSFSRYWDCLIQGHEFSCKNLHGQSSLEAFRSWSKTFKIRCELTLWISAFGDSIEPSIMSLVLNHAKGVMPTKPIVKTAMQAKLKLSSIKVLLADIIIDADFVLDCDSRDKNDYPYLLEMAFILLKKCVNKTAILTNFIRYARETGACISELISCLPRNRHVGIVEDVRQFLVSLNDAHLISLFLLKFPIWHLLLCAFKQMPPDSVIELIHIHPNQFCVDEKLFLALAETLNDEQMCHVIDCVYPSKIVPSSKIILTAMLTKRCSDKLIQKILRFFHTMNVTIATVNEVVDSMNSKNIQWSYSTLASIFQMVPRSQAWTRPTFLASLPPDLDEDIFMTFAWSLPSHYKNLIILLEHRVSPVNIKTFARRAFGSELGLETAKAILMTARESGYDDNLYTFLEEIFGPKE